MSKQVWQLQLRKQRRVVNGDSTFDWRDIVTVADSDTYGPGTKAQAIASLAELRKQHPGAVYRIVKVSPL